MKNSLIKEGIRDRIGVLESVQTLLLLISDLLARF